MTIKKDDSVIIISGRDKGKTGKVTRVFPKIHKVLVSGINMMKKRQKPRQQGQKGQVVEVNVPIDISNVKLESAKKPAKKTTAKAKK